MDKTTACCWVLVLRAVAILLWRSIYRSHINDSTDEQHKECLHAINTMARDLAKQI